MNPCQVYPDVSVLLLQILLTRPSSASQLAMMQLPVKKGLFWPFVAGFLASMLTMTSTMESGPCNSCERGGDSSNHYYLIHERAKRGSPESSLGDSKPKVCAKGDAICIPANYSKFDLPDETLTIVNVGIDIKDIPKIDDKEFSITLNAFFVVRWTDTRMIIDQVYYCCSTFPAAAHK